MKLFHNSWEKWAAITLIIVIICIYLQRTIYHRLIDMIDEIMQPDITFKHTMEFRYHFFAYFIASKFSSILDSIDASMNGTNGDPMSQSAYGVAGSANATTRSLLGHGYSYSPSDSSDMESPNAGSPLNGMKMASIKARPSCRRMMGDTTNEVTHVVTDVSKSGKKQPKVYASVSEMKKAKVS